jgi:hypothetical protein
MVNSDHQLFHTRAGICKKDKKHVEWNGYFEFYLKEETTPILEFKVMAKPLDILRSKYVDVLVGEARLNFSNYDSTVKDLWIKIRNQQKGTGEIRIQICVIKY